MDGWKKAFAVLVGLLGGLIILSALVALGAFTAIALQTEFEVMWIIAAVADVLLLTFYIVNAILSKKNAAKVDKIKPSELFSEMLSKKEETEKMVFSLREEILKKYKATFEKVIIFYVFAAITIFLNGFCYEIFSKLDAEPVEYYQIFATLAAIVFVVVFMGSLVVLYFLIHGTLVKWLNRNKVKNAEYPATYKMIKDIFDEEGVDKKIKVFLSDDFNAGIAEEKNEIVITIGILLLKFLTKEELKAVIYHEIAHFKNADTHFSKQKDKYYNRLSKLLPSDTYTMIAPELITIGKDDMILSYVSNIAFERNADEAVLSKNVGNDFASAAIKTFGLEYAYRLIRYDVELALCETKKWTKEIVEMLLNGYRDFFNAHKDFFVLCSERHLEALIPSHPNVRQRVEKFSDGKKLNVELACTTEYDDDIMIMYEKVNERFISKENEDVWNNIKKQYEEYAVNRDEAIEKDLNIDDVEALSLIDSAYGYGEYDLAKRIGLHILKKSPDNSRSNLIVGLIYAFIDFSDECLPYLIHNVEEENSSFKEASLSALLEYYSITGREEERNKLRETAPTQMDDIADMNDALTLNANDELFSYGDEEIINHIIEIAKESNDVYAVSIGTKKRNDRYCHHVVIFYRKKIADEKSFKKACDDVWAYLDLKNDQFCLTTAFYLSLPDNHALKKAPLLVYKREK